PVGVPRNDFRAQTLQRGSVLLLIAVLRRKKRNVVSVVAQFPRKFENPQVSAAAVVVRQNLVYQQHVLLGRELCGRAARRSVVIPMLPPRVLNSVHRIKMDRIALPHALCFPCEKKRGIAAQRKRESQPRQMQQRLVL